mmetsp:Transcript_30479/g.40549  ORF Transcript_30479/g.40549 Transcript_30479/m.40549 type:complete len:103 (+) Transcript_30479:119-427(+)
MAINLLTYNKLQNLLVSHLYKKPSTYWETKEDIKGPRELNADDQSVSMELCQNLFCCGRKCCCGSGDMTDKLFTVGRESLARDLNIVRLIRSLRVVERYIDD